MKKKLLSKFKSLIPITGALMISLSVSAQNYTLTKVMIKTDYAWNTSNNCRDMALSGDNLYVVDKAGKLLHALHKADGAEMIANNISGTTITGYSVAADSQGNMFATEGAYGMTKTIKGGTIIDQKYTYLGSKEVTGATGRFDYVDIHEDISQNGIMISPASNAGQIAYWTFKNSAIADASTPKFFTSPSGYTGADVSIVDNKNFWLSGQNCKPTKYTLSDDYTVSSTASINFAANAGGIKAFSMKGKDFVALSSTALGIVNIYDVTNMATPTLIGSTEAVGSTVNASVHLGIEVEINDNVATIYTWVPNNGLSIYTLTVAVPPIYLIGQTEANGNEWNPTKGTTLSYAGNDTYSGRIFFGSKDIPTPVFAISTVLAENNDGGGWSYVNSNRYGASSNPTLNPFNATTITKDPNYGFTIASGTYDVTVDMTAKTINCVPVLYIMGTTDKTNYTWAADNGAEFTYNGSGTYTLQDVLISRADGHKIRGNFAITNCLNADWDITNAYRYGPTTDLSIIDQNLTDLTKANTSYQAKGGTYNINIDMNTKKISITSLDDPDAIPAKLYIIGNIDGVTPKADATDYFNPSSYTKYLELNAAGNYDGYVSGMGDCLFSLSTEVSIDENDLTGFNEGRLGAETDQLLLSVGDDGFALTPKGTNSFKLPTTNSTRITVSPSKNLISIGHTTGTETIDTETGVKVIASYGEINVIGNVSTIEVYSANGTLISKGEQNVKCQAGLYIVKFDNKVTKVIVK